MNGTAFFAYYYIFVFLGCQSSLFASCFNQYFGLLDCHIVDHTFKQFALLLEPTYLLLSLLDLQINVLGLGINLKRHKISKALTPRFDHLRRSTFWEKWGRSRFFVFNLFFVTYIVFVLTINDKVFLRIVMARGFSGKRKKCGCMTIVG